MKKTMGYMDIYGYIYMDMDSWSTLHIQWTDMSTDLLVSTVETNTTL